MRRWRSWPAFAVGLALLLVWEGAARLFRVPAWLLPPPSRIVATLVSGGDLLAVHAVRTLEETVLGLAAAFVLGVGTAVAMHRWESVRRALYPILVASQTVPVVTLAPLLTIWLGFDIRPKLVVVALICFFPLTVATFDGLRAVDPDALRLLRSMGASPRQVFWCAEWPGALPSIFTGTRIAATYGVIGAIVGEWVGASVGLGIYMQRASDQFLTDRVFAAIVVSALLSVALFLAVGALERLLVPWHSAGEQS